MGREQQDALSPSAPPEHGGWRGSGDIECLLAQRSEFCSPPRSQGGGGIRRAVDRSTASSGRPPPVEHHGAEQRGARLGSATVTPGDRLRDGRNRSPAAEPAAPTPACSPPPLPLPAPPSLSLTVMNYREQNAALQDTHPAVKARLVRAYFGFPFNRKNQLGNFQMNIQPKSRVVRQSGST